MTSFHQSRNLILASFMTLSLAITPAYSSQLRDFEESATRPDRDTATRESSVFDELMGEIIASCLGFVVLTVFVEPIGALASSARDRVNVDYVPEDVERDTSRSIGDPDLPFFRLDLNYQRVSSNIDGIDGRFEIGYGPYAVQARHTRYEEKKPSEKLNFTSIHGLLRLSEDNRFEMGLGAGALLLDGDRHTSGFSITCPINWYPHRRMAIRVVPTISWLGGNSIGDYDVSAGYTRPYFSLQSGYRWLRSGDETIHGPYIGFSLHY